jgi:hypothetical protein
MSFSALNQKGRRQFLRSKWLKLGVPVLMYALVAPPIQGVILKFTNHEELKLENLVSNLIVLRGVQGPVW